MKDQKIEQKNKQTLSVFEYFRLKGENFYKDREKYGCKNQKNSILWELDANLEYNNGNKKKIEGEKLLEKKNF